VSAAEHATTEWDHKDLWRKHGKDFLIEVSRHNASPSSIDMEAGPHRWCVYAYIYPKHPHFANFNGPRMWQDATRDLPLHGGASLLDYPMYEGKVTSAKVGADYNHLGDTEFTHMATKEDAAEIFVDAECLFAWLQKRAAGGAS
jgi:hypothetical protein